MRLLRERIAAFDRRALDLLQSRESAALTRAMRTLTHLGDPGSWVVVGLALAAAGGRGPRLAALLGLGAGLAVAGSQLLKRLCCRPRPSTATGAGAPRIEDPDAFSFPSGHTAAAFGVAAALAGEAHGLALLTLTLAGAIGLSRVYLGAHYPLDVAAGALLGTLAGLAARLLLAAWAASFFLSRLG